MTYQGDSAYNPAVWLVGYQARQFGVSGPSIFNALVTPPTTMATALAVAPDTTHHEPTE